MKRFFCVSGLTVLVALLLFGGTKAQQLSPRKVIDDDGMSPMGHRAATKAKARAKAFLESKGIKAPVRFGIGADENGTDDETVPCDDNGCDPGSEEDNPTGGQAEMAIAIDLTGSHLVVGFNDTRGFALNPTSVSGFAYSDDGGATFVDGGQLPAPSNGQLSNGTLLPQVFGDPDVKYLGACVFIYSSIMVKGIGTPSGTPLSFPGTAQTMSLHRSVDCGHTWTGPFEVAPATNPNGLLSGANARDAADKEFLDVDPDTGRVMMSWSNFTTITLGGVEIRTTYSDNAMSGSPPTWSASSVINPGSPTFDTGSIPRFAGGGSTRAYVAWSSTSNTTGLVNTRVATSTDNGVTWGAPVALATSDFFSIDYILGNDRIHSFPGLAVGPEGNVYVVYSSNNSHDGADISFQRSTNGGASFSPPILLNSAPGLDRSQWFPVAATDLSGRVYVTYYGQVGTSGDLTQATYMFSNDGGATWSKPSGLMSAGCVGIATDPLDCRPFHAGYGNDTGQPNLGDYNGAVTFGGTLYAVWAATPRRVSFTDGQPDGSFTVPDFYINKVNSERAALVFSNPTFTESGGNGFVDAGDQVRFQFPLRNLVTNPVSGALTYTGVTGTLSTSTPGVTILAPTRSYPNIAPAATMGNTADYVVAVAPTFVPGTRIEFLLNVTTGQGSTSLPFTQNTGTPVPTTIFAQNFNSTAVASLPAGWATIHAGGANTVPWTTNNTFCGTTSNALFHANANDGVSGTGNPTRFERVATPNILVPANPGSAAYVTLDFDVCYDTEDEPAFNVLAYDGGLLRITDFTTGRFARATLVEAFAEFITTGNFLHYPKHNPRSNSTAYFQDMSMWAGDSNGFKHVNMRLPGMQGSTVQLRPDFTQDSLFTCTDVRPTHTTCGVMIDNIVMRSVVTKSDELLRVTLTPVAGVPGQYNGTVTSQAVAPTGGIAVNLSGTVSAGTISLPASVTIPAGSQTSPSFTVTVSPAASGVTGTVTATGPSNVRTAAIRIL